MSDITAEDVANALENKQIMNAFGLTPPNPYDALKTDEIHTDSQLNQRLMTPQWDSTKLKTMNPKMKIEKCFVVKKGKDGKPVFFNGKPVVEEKEVKCFDGFETKTIDVPSANIFLPDMRTSVLRPEDRNIMQILTDLYFFVLQESLATETDFSYDLYFIEQKLGSILNISPSLGGKIADLLKTQITRGEQTNVVRQMLLQDQRKGIFGMFKRQQQPPY